MFAILLRRGTGSSIGFASLINAVTVQVKSALIPLSACRLTSATIMASTDPRRGPEVNFGAAEAVVARRFTKPCGGERVCLRVATRTCQPHCFGHDACRT